MPLHHKRMEGRMDISMNRWNRGEGTRLKGLERDESDRLNWAYHPLNTFIIHNSIPLLNLSSLGEVYEVEKHILFISFCSILCFVESISDLSRWEIH